METKRRQGLFLWASMLCLAALGVWLVARGQPSLSQQDSELDSPPVLETLADHNEQRLRSHKRQLQQSRRRTTASQNAHGIAGYDAATVDKLRESAFVAHRARAMFNRDQLVKNEVEAFIQNPDAVHLALDVVTDYTLAARIYGEDQAFARIHAIRVLRHLAKTGHHSHVEEAVIRLGAKLNEMSVWEKGIDHDYVALLSTYIRAMGLTKILDDPETFLATIGHTPKTSLQIHKAFWDSGILRDIEETKLTKLATYFESEDT